MGGWGGGGREVLYWFCFLLPVFFYEDKFTWCNAFETFLKFYKAKPNFLTFKDYMHENKFVPQYNKKCQKKVMKKLSFNTTTK